MPAFCSGFVDADATQVREVHAVHRGLDVVLDDSPQPCVVLADEARDGRHRHVRDERHGQRLEQQREAGTGPGPGHRDLLDAAIGTGDARRARVEKDLVLEEIQMPPFLHRGVMHRAVGFGTVRTRKVAAAREVDLDVEALLGHVEIAGLHQPRRHETERQLEQINVTHATLSVAR